ncbi:unnamed protein product [Phytophthora fragariaefolia]|uniref:Unnamed protein product n=1 Tax=Phytophthora fragariaefolia TaxID=1490495 RepID=A0A9W6YAH0_9STRA|nr:unnamed protein product [Phytophthora fragariaefolia]
MARWLSFFAEYNFEVKYKPGKQNALADALSRRPDYELARVTTVTSSIPDLIRASMDFVFGLPPDAAGNTGVVVFVDRLSKMAHLAAVPDTIDGEGTASLFLDRVFRQHGLPEAVVSDRDPGSRASSGRPSSRCLALAWTCPPRIIRRPTVRRNASIALSRMSSAAFALKRLSVGAPCSHSLSLR